MNNKLQEFIDSIDYNDLESFQKKTKSDFVINKDTEKIVIDYSWVSFIEECLPYIDSIIRNPRKFLIQEEDIAVVEKTKKVTKETIKHLAVNSNLIQDIDDNGDVKPKKLLNVYKEDTFDIYENRFLYSLMKRLYSFLELQLEYQDHDSHISEKRVVSFKSETLQAKENVIINVSLETDSYKLLNIDSTAYKKRINNINNIIDGFMESSFIKSLRMASLVKSPIRKTNIILKDTNFRKCLELWEFLEKYEADKIIKITKYNDIDKSLEKKARFLYAGFMDYQALDYECENKKQKRYELYLQKSMDECLNDLDFTDKEYRHLVEINLKQIRHEQEQEKEAIKNKFKSFISDTNKVMDKSIEILNY